MKHRKILHLGLLLFLAGGLFSCQRNEMTFSIPEDSITVYSTSELSDISSNWASIYAKLNPDVKIEVIETTESELLKNLDRNGYLGFIADEYHATGSGGTMWQEVV